MHARVTRFNVSVENIEEMNAYFNGKVVPTYAALPGYKGALSFVERTTGNWESITFWDSDESLRASEAAANKLRQTAKIDFNTSEMTVDMYEVQTDKREPALDQQMGTQKAAQGPQRTRH